MPNKWRTIDSEMAHQIDRAPCTHQPQIRPYPLLLTRAASEHARPHAPPNLALILAWTYGAVARALGSLVKWSHGFNYICRQSLLPQDRFQYILARERKDVSHAMLQCTYCITTILPNQRVYVGTTGISTIPKRARRPKRRDPYPVPPLRRTRGEGDTSTERQTRRIATHHQHQTDRTQAPLWHEDDFVAGHAQTAILY